MVGVITQSSKPETHGYVLNSTEFGVKISFWGQRKTGEV